MMYWHKLLDTLSLTHAKIVVLDLLPVIETRYTNQASLIRYNSDVKRYNMLIKNICRKRNISFFQRYHLWQNNNLKKRYTDATHPNHIGHQIIADEIFNYLEEHHII